MLDQTLSIFQKYPFLSIPLFILALYFLFQFVKKIVIRILALAVILLAIFICYTLFIQPKTGLPKVKTIKEETDKTLQDMKKTIKTAQELKEKAEKLNEEGKEALESLTD